MPKCKKNIIVENKRIGDGAEAIVYLNNKNNIDKSRIKKAYRISEIDIPLRKSRTRREANILKKLENLIPVPKLIKQEEYSLEMENIQGTQLKKILDKKPELAKLIGKSLTIIHNDNVIHGDLTTSNMILKKEVLYFIDFGLSFMSNKVEDKAVDIHLFKQALESKHYKIFEKAYKDFLSAYKPTQKKEILKRLEQVESRGRYK